MTFAHGVYRLSGDTWEKIGDGNMGILTDFILAFGADRENNLWIACEDRKETRFLSNRSGVWESACSFPLGLKHTDEVTCFTVDRDEKLWVGRRWGGLMVWNGKKWKRLTEKDCSLLYGEMKSLMIDEFDNLWVDTSGGFAIFDGSKWHDWGAIRPDSTQQPVRRHDLLGDFGEMGESYVYIGGYVAKDSIGRKWMWASGGIAMFVPQSD